MERPLHCGGAELIMDYTAGELTNNINTNKVGDISFINLKDALITVIKHPACLDAPSYLAKPLNKQPKSRM